MTAPALLEADADTFRHVLNVAGRLWDGASVRASRVDGSWAFMACDWATGQRGSPWFDTLGELAAWLETRAARERKA